MPEDKHLNPQYLPRGGLVSTHSKAMPCTQRVCSAKFCMSANSQTLVLAPFHKVFVPCRCFSSFLCIWGGGGGSSTGYPFECYGGTFLVRDMDRPLSIWGYGLAPFKLGIWFGPFPAGDMGFFK